MKEMSLREMIGQRLLVGLPSAEVDDKFIDLVKEWKIGNVILMRRNIHNKQQLAALCGQIQSIVQKHTGQPALIAIDQEGGSVVRLPDDATNVPGAMAIASTGKPEYAMQAGRITGMELRALGVNFDLAPVLDVNSNPGNPVIAERSYGDTADTVVDFGIAMMHGLAEGGVLSCAKHFPGHGDTDVDSHLDLPVINKSIEELEATELKPFATAIKEGIPAVMTSHIWMPAFENEKLPNTLSRKVITGLLRDKMGFDGLVVTDCLEMEAIRTYYGTGQGAVQAAKAGVDLLCICHTPALMIEAATLLLQSAEAEELSMVEMKKSVERILNCKQQLATMQIADISCVGSEEHTKLAQEMREAGICLVGAPKEKLPALGEKPLFVGSYAFRSTIASSPIDDSVCFPKWMAENLGGAEMLCSLNPSEDEIAEAVKLAQNSTCVVMGSYNGLFQAGQVQLMHALAKTGTPTIIIALRSPYDLEKAPSSTWRIAAFEYTIPCFKSLAQILSGKNQMSGKLSVKLKAAQQ